MYAFNKVFSHFSIDLSQGNWLSASQCKQISLNHIHYFTPNSYCMLMILLCYTINNRLLGAARMAMISFSKTIWEQNNKVSWRNIWSITIVPIIHSISLFSHTVPSFSGDILKLTKLSRGEMGSYLCIASNGMFNQATSS